MVKLPANRWMLIVSVVGAVIVMVVGLAMKDPIVLLFPLLDQYPITYTLPFRSVVALVVLVV